MRGEAAGMSDVAKMRPTLRRALERAEAATIDFEDTVEEGGPD